MDRAKLTEQLDRMDDTKVEALASSLLVTARATPRAAIEVAQRKDELASIKARHLLIQLEELAIAPLAEASEPADTNERVFFVTQAVEAELALRRKVIARIDKLLDDKTPVPTRIRGPVEQKPPPRRVCDEAYLLMRQIVHFGEPITEAQVQAKMFLEAPDAFKDAQIKKARSSGVWNRAIDVKNFEEYDDDRPPSSTPRRPPPKR